MKSEKAKQFIDNGVIQMHNGDRMVDASTAYTALDLAEQEAEERIREKAGKIFTEILYMPARQLAKGGIVYCRTLFIQKLNEDENY